MTRHRFLALAAVIVVVASLGGALGACASDADTLTVYSGRSDPLIGPLLEQFADEHDVDVEVRYGDSADLALLIDEEGDRTPADVVISQSPGAVGFLDLKGRLEPLSDDVLGSVSTDYRAPDGEWVGLTGRVRVLVYNTDLVSPDELPASVFDVTEERYRDQVGVAPTNGSFQDFVSVMREDVGDEATLEWLEGLVANGARTYANNSAIRDAVGRGEIPMGLVNHYYNERALAEDPSEPTVNYFFEDGDIGSTILVTAAGILAGTDQQDAADELIHFLLSEQAQEYFAQETFEYPLAAGVSPATDLPPLDSIAAPPADLAALGADLEATKELIVASGLEQS